LLCALNIAVPARAQSGASLSLEDALKTLGGAGAGAAELRWDPFFSTGTFTAGDHRAAFTSGRAGETGPVLLDAKEVLRLPLPYIENGGISFPEAFVTQIKNAFARYAEEDRSRFRVAAVIIDPGHGGKDPGTEGSHVIQGKPLKLTEKDLTLKAARQVHASLAAAFPGIRLLLTREGDTYPTLEERAEMANALPLAGNEVAIYVSIHANASPNKAARGFEVWYLSRNYRREVIDRSRYAETKEVIPILNSMLEEELTTESILMARYILKRLEEASGGATPSRGLKEWDWSVLRNARMPAVLIEMPFLTNEADALLMSDDAYLKKLSEAIYKGIADFIGFFESVGDSRRGL
jgi:N-acetylmuramoyl-L-alanine amidase